MHLENLVFDAVEPQILGRFWEHVVGGERLTDAPGIYETRLAVEGGPWLDLCFQPVAGPPTGHPRLRVLLLDGAGPAVDPEGNPCPVVEDPAAYAGSGPIAALRLASADPARDASFWSWLTGWTDVSDGGRAAVRHPSGRGPVLELVAEDRPKGSAKNRLHLDVRLEAGEDADTVAAAIAERGGRELHLGWGELPWRHYADPSGNELCVLPATAD
jgi:hypothetical protein